MEPTPHPVRIERNNHHEDDNDIRPNDNAIGIDNHMKLDIDNYMELPNYIPNGDAVENNLSLLGRIEDDIEPNNFNVDDENEDDDKGEGEQEMNDRANKRERVEDISNWNIITLNAFTLEHIKNVLYNGLHQLFDKFEVKIAGCPRLTRPPYNLAADGLSGNTVVCDLGDEYNNLVPVPLKNKIYDIQDVYFRHSYCDSFIIGTGYAAKESMSSNGHLTINATISPCYELFYNRCLVLSTTVNNNSCIVNQEANTGDRILYSLRNPNEMKCSMLSTLFISEGRKGKVIKVFAKGRRSHYDIITLIQNCLYRYHQDTTIALGGVLNIHKGRMMQHITPENYPERFSTLEDFNRWLICHEMDCRNLITVGAIVNFESNDLGPLRNEEPNL